MNEHRRPWAIHAWILSNLPLIQVDIQILKLRIEGRLKKKKTLHRFLQWSCTAYKSATMLNDMQNPSDWMLEDTREIRRPVPQLLFQSVLQVPQHDCVTIPPSRDVKTVHDPQSSYMPAFKILCQLPMKPSEHSQKTNSSFTHTHARMHTGNFINISEEDVWQKLLETEPSVLMNSNLLLSQELTPP